MVWPKILTLRFLGERFRNLIWPLTWKSEPVSDLFLDNSWRKPQCNTLSQPLVLESGCWVSGKPFDQTFSCELISQLSPMDVFKGYLTQFFILTVFHLFPPLVYRYNLACCLIVVNISHCFISCSFLYYLNFSAKCSSWRLRFCTHCITNGTLILIHITFQHSHAFACESHCWQ